MQVVDDEPTKAYAVGLCSAEYAEQILRMSRGDAMSKCVGQLDNIFSTLEPQHMVGNVMDVGKAQNISDLKKPSDSFIGGTFWDWTPEHHPYIGGGYCSPKAGTPAWKIQILGEPLGKRLFFAGESTIVPGTCIHAAMDSGTRAANNVANVLADNADDDQRNEKTYT